MNILLLSMPDSFEHTATVAMRMPNGALVSLAGNVDPHHRIAIADLILVQRRVRETVERLVRELEPDVVGLSVMTFQRRTAHKVVKLIRALRPQTRIVVGGYDPSLATDVYEDPSWGIDAIVRGEGDITFRELLRRFEAGEEPHDVAGLSYRSGAEFVRTPNRPVSSLAGEEVRLPNRSARVLDGYTFLGRRIDVVETSRGCTYDCSFCSIIEMRGRNFHTWTIERVLADIADARHRGARAVFIVDDNITLNVARFKALCEAITQAGLNDIDYIVQGMTSSIAAAGEPLAAAMRAAGFRYVFLGIENVLEERSAIPARLGEERDPRAGPAGGERDDSVNRAAAPPWHVRRRRIDRGKSGRHASVHRRQPHVRPRVHRLAVHPASDTVSRYADDEGFPGASAHRERPRRGIRWNDGRGAQ